MAVTFTTPTVPKTPYFIPPAPPRDLSLPARDVTAAPPSEPKDIAVTPKATPTPKPEATATPPAPQTTQPTYSAIANTNAPTIRGVNLDLLT